MTKQNGFTLAEVAMVLAIVGLLTGGVMKGHEMISNAKLKRIEKDYTHVGAAISSYLDRYRQLPGDDASASTRFSIYTDGINDPADLEINGGGDGKIDGDWIAEEYTESSNLWKHLRAAGIIAGSGDDYSQMQNAFGGMIGVRDGSLLLPGRVVIFGQIEGTIARIIEGRLDDGSPSTGSTQSDVTEASMNNNVVSSAGNSYDDSSRYHLAISL